MQAVWLLWLGVGAASLPTEPPPSPCPSAVDIHDPVIIGGLVVIGILLVLVVVFSSLLCSKSQKRHPDSKHSPRYTQQDYAQRDQYPRASDPYPYR